MLRNEQKKFHIKKHSFFNQIDPALNDCNFELLYCIQGLVLLNFYFRNLIG